MSRINQVPGASKKQYSLFLPLIFLESTELQKELIKSLFFGAYPELISTTFSTLSSLLFFSLLQFWHESVLHRESKVQTGSMAILEQNLIKVMLSKVFSVPLLWFTNVYYINLSCRQFNFCNLKRKEFYPNAWKTKMSSFLCHWC